MQQYLIPRPVGGLGGAAALVVEQPIDYVTALGIPRDLIDNTLSAFRDALDNGGVRTVLNTDNLSNAFLTNLSTFTVKIINPIIKLTQHVSGNIGLGRISINDFSRVELALGRELARLIRATNYSRAEDLVYALSILIEHDQWVINNVVKYGFDGLMDRINKRALNEVGETSAYLMATIFAWYSATTAVLGIVREFRRENLNALAQWSRAYAEELDAYIDTLDLLISDETYETLREEDVIKQ